MPRADDAPEHPRTGVPNAVRRKEITRADLPLHCPTDDMPLWSSHPRVFLPIEETGEELCPYCGTLFVLVDEE
jgi:uncharacterized Zn-finger protein